MPVPAIRGFQPSIQDPDSLRDAIVAIRRDNLSVRNACQKYHVPTRIIKSAINSLTVFEEVRGAPLAEDSRNRQVFRWATEYTKGSKSNKSAYTDWELNEAMLRLLTGESKTFNVASFGLGIPRRTFDRHMKDILSALKIKSFKACQKMVNAKEITRGRIRAVIDVRKKILCGRPCYLTRDEEALVIATAEVKVAHAMPVTRKLLSEKLHNILQGLGKRSTEVTLKTKQAYARDVIRRVNKIEDEQAGQRKRSSTGEIKVRGLSHKRAKQCDPRLQWLMFHKLTRMARDIRKKEEENATTLTQKRDGSAHKNAADALLGFAKSVVPTTPSPSPTPVPTTILPSPTPVPTPTSPGPTPLSTTTSPSPTPVSPTTSPSPTPVSTTTSPSPTPLSTSNGCAAKERCVLPSLPCLPTHKCPDCLVNIHALCGVANPDKSISYTYHHICFSCFEARTCGNIQAPSPTPVSTPTSPGPTPPSTTTPSPTHVSTTTSPSPTPVSTTHKDGDSQEERAKKRRHVLCKQLCSLEDARKSLAELTVIPKDLKMIQPRPSQTWNVDEIGLDPNGKWTRIVCTYKWCPIDQIWKVQTGERAPFWVTLLLFTRADGACFVPPVVVHQAAELTAAHQLNIPSDWIVHCTKSGYMDRDGWFKSILKFVRICGAYETNINILTFDGHDSHWDADALDHMANNFVQPFLLKAGDSTTDQPNDNGFNAKCKSVYAEEKAKWDETFLTTTYTPPMMNMVLVSMWERLVVESGHTIKKSFDITNLVPLRPPTQTEFTGYACVASLQCGSGKKVQELEVVKQDVMGTSKLTSKRTSNEKIILQAENSTSRNLLLRAAAYDIINKTVVIPAQELKDIQLEINNAKAITLGSYADPRESRMNPDSSSGLYVTAEYRAAARRVATLKEQDKREKAQKAVSTASKNAELATKKKQAFDRTIESIKMQQDKSIRRGLTSHNPKTDIKLAFQHAGGVLSDCSNTRYSTYIDTIMAKYVSVYEAALSTTSTTTSTNSTSTNDTSTSTTSMREEEEDFVAVEV